MQDTVCNALRSADSFIPETNFPAWMHRILRNRFISDIRRRRDTTDVADVPESMFATNASQGDRLALKELGSALNRLPADQREALVMVVVHGISYEELAKQMGVAVGTAKSRVFRARRQLQAWLLGDQIGPIRLEVGPAKVFCSSRATGRKLVYSHNPGSGVWGCQTGASPRRS